MQYDELIASFRLALTRGLGPFSYMHMINRFGTASEAIKQMKYYRHRLFNNLVSIDFVKREYEKIISFGAELIPYNSKEYPELLKKIDHPPMFIMIKGDKSLLYKKSLGIVGSRNASSNALHVTARFTKELGKRGFIIVSGMARGIDAKAHENSLQTGTIAVLAGGLANIFPPENKNLYHEISEHGLLLSENPLDMIATARSFPRRNRIISGLSKGVIVIEANIRSGSLITANYALDQGREVFAIPGSILDERSSGTNKLIKDGAILVQNIDDVLIPLGNIDRLYEKNYMKKIDDRSGFFDNVSDNLSDVVSENDDKLSKDQYMKYKEIIYNLLSSSPTDKDIVYRQSKVPFNFFSDIVIELIFAEKIVEVQPGFLAKKLEDEE